jgi:hypothetical protein
MRPFLTLLALALPTIALTVAPTITCAAPLPATLSPLGKPLFEAKTPEEAALTLKRLNSQPFLEVLQKMAFDRGFRQVVNGRFRGEKVGDRRVRLIIEGLDADKIRPLEEALVEMMAGKIPEADRQRFAQMYEEAKQRLERLERFGGRLPPNFLEQERTRAESYRNESSPPILRKLR